MAAPAPLAGPAIATALPQSIVRQAVPTAAIPSGADLFRTLLPASIGAALVLVPTMTLFPRRATVAASLGTLAGALMAASAPPLTLAQEIGMGAALAGGTWMVTRAVGEIRLPATTGATVAAVAIPPMTLPSGAQITFGRRVA